MKKNVKYWPHVILVALGGAVLALVISMVVIGTTINREVKFTELELKGNTFERPVERLLDLLPQYQAMASKALAGDADAKKQLKGIEQQIDQAFGELAKNYHDLSKALRLTDAEFWSHNHENARLSSLQAQWQSLKEAPLGVAASAEATDKLVSAIQTVITRVGDTSHQILDSELDSYYLVDGTIDKLPKAQERLGRITMQVGGWLRRGAAASHRTDIAVMAAMLREADLKDIVGDIQNALTEHENYSGVSESLQRNLPPVLAKYAASNQAFLELLNRVVEGERVPDAEALESAGWAARAASFQLWQSSSSELGHLLSKRIAFFRHQWWINFGSIGAGLGLLLLAIQLMVARLRQEQKERTLAQGELRASEARYRQLHESMMDAFSSVDTSGRIIDCNETFRKMLGYGPDEITALTYLDITPKKWHAFEKAIFEDQVLKRGYSEIYEKEYRRKDGSVFPAELRSVLLKNDAGKPSGMWAIVRDVTTRKQAEAALHRQLAFDELITKLLAQFVSCTVSEIDEQIRLSLREIAAFTGAEYARVILVSRDGATWSITHEWHGPEIPSLLHKYQKVQMGSSAWTEALLLAGKPVQICSLADLPPEAAAIRDRWVAEGLRSTLQVPLHGRGGLVQGCVGLFGVSHEVAWKPEDLQRLNLVSDAIANALERKRSEEALRQAHNELELRVRERTAELVAANERLRDLDRLKSQFLATMSHELRTPLNSIIGFTGILRKGFAGPLTTEQQKQVEFVYASATHLLSLINDLLDLSRIEAGKVELEAQLFDFAGVVAEVLAMLAPMAKQKGLILVSDLSEPVIPLVGDRKRCFQVLLNLANNAVKFTSCGQVKISAQLKQDTLLVCVADTGIGIKPEQMGMLFEAFRQLDGSAKRHYEGTGLGLHVCQRLLRLMGGEIKAESEFGRGSRFTFTLPLQHQNAEPFGLPKQPAEEVLK